MKLETKVTHQVDLYAWTDEEDTGRRYVTVAESADRARIFFANHVNRQWELPDFEPERIVLLRYRDYLEGVWYVDGDRA